MPLRRTRRILSVLLCVIAFLSLAGQAQAADNSPVAGKHNGPVIVIGTSGVRWDDVSPTATPHLWSLLVHGSQSAMTIRNVRRAACPVDGWLALSAGSRAVDLPADPGTLCRRVPSPGSQGYSAVVTGWSGYVAYANNGDFGSKLGLLADQLTQGHVSYAAIGPGAAIALASSADGVVHGAYTAVPADAGALTAAVTAALTNAKVVVVDAGDVRDPVDLSTTDPDSQSGPRAQQVAAIDERVGAVQAAAPANATVIVASLADSGITPHLQVLGITGPTPAGDTPASYLPSLLGSESTRQNGLVQVTDLVPTVLDLVGITPPNDLPGAAILPISTTATPLAARRQKLLDLDAAAIHIQSLVPPFFNGLVIAQILLYGAGTLALRRQWGGPAGRTRVLAMLRRAAIIFSAVPVATFLANLVPWWRASDQLLAIVGAVCVGTLLIAGVAMLGPWRDRRLGPLGFIGGITAAVLAVDVATGSRLQMSSLMGLQPLIGGRFYGLGNVEFALFASGTLMLAISLADAALKLGRRRLAVVIVVLIGAFTVVIDGTPGLGTDFGGPPATIPAFLLMALLVAGVRINVKRLLLIGAVTLAVMVVLSIADWLRPAADQTHLGRFVQTLINGGAWDVVSRKAIANWTILTSSWLTVLVPFGAVFIGAILMRPVAWGAPALQRTYEAAPALKSGLISLCVLMAIGFAANDSGTAIPAIGAVLVIPLLIAASVKTLEIADHEPEQAANQPRTDGATLA